MPALALRLGLALCAAAPLVAQEPAPELVRHQGGIYAFDLPASWRELGPNEAVKLRDRLPLDMREVRAGSILVFGDVDRWLANGFDGRALLLIGEEFEHPTSEAEVATIREFFAAWKGPGSARRDVLDAKLTTLGKDAHPAIEVSGKLVGGTTDGTDLHTLDYYVSTSGQRLILSFRALEPQWQDAEPLFRRLAASTLFARPPQPPSGFSDKLLWPVFFGAITGLALLVASKLRRRPTGPGAGA